MIKQRPNWAKNDPETSLWLAFSLDLINAVEISQSNEAVRPAVEWEMPSRYNRPMQVIVEIPDQFVSFLLPEGTDASRKLLEDTVAAAYRQRRLTMEQVRQLLGFATRIEVDPFLQRYEIYDDTVEDLRQDMAAMKEFMEKRSAEQKNDRCRGHQPRQLHPSTWAAE